MFKSILYISLTLSSLLLSACHSDIEVQTKVSTKVNLDGYKTYKWLVTENVLFDTDKQYKMRDYNVTSYIKSEISKQLTMLEKKETTSKPDFLVSYFAGLNMDALKEKLNEQGKRFVESVPKAAIAVLLIDTKTKRIIYATSAQAQSEVKHSDEESKKRISYAIDAMFKSFRNK